MNHDEPHPGTKGAKPLCTLKGAEVIPADPANNISDDILRRQLKSHLQGAVNLELWTIPFYLSVMYSIKDRTSKAYQLIRTVVNQEMLHLQCASNIANAYGLSPEFSVPEYEGQTIPYLNFALDKPEVIEKFQPYTAEIGPLDEEHVNAMCLIEIPTYLAEKNDQCKKHAEIDSHFKSSEVVEIFQNINEYGSIGAFYEALYGLAKKFKSEVRGSVRQVDYFSAFYRNAPNLQVTEFAEDGFQQVELLIALILDQGEGMSVKRENVNPVFQNTADDQFAKLDHFEKFLAIKGEALPEVFPTKDPKSYTPEDLELERILTVKLNELMGGLTKLFNGDNSQDFFPLMASVGACIRNCWEHGITPKIGNHFNEDR